MRAGGIAVATVVAGFGLATDAAAVTLNSDGLGQALIYPYYTVLSADNNAFNTYLTVVNTTQDAKAIRVVMREGQAGRQVLGFNLFLSAYDVWTGAVVPTASGAQILSTDASCVNPPMDATGAPGMRSYPLLTTDFPEVPSDGAREGYVEMIEMATLTGASLAAVTHDASGVPPNCAAVQGQNASALTGIAAPSGGLMGTVTLINVALGEDFTVNAEALQSLSTEPFYRNFDSAYPDFDAAEVTPVSEVTAGGMRYRLTWSRGVDAVSSVMMQSATTNEYVLDSATASRTDWVSTMPTRRFYRTATSVTAPFGGPAGGTDCDLVDFIYYDREARGPTPGGIDFAVPPPLPPALTYCHAATVWPFINASSHAGPVFGSVNTLRGYYGGVAAGVPVTDTFQNGWARITYSGSGAATQGLTSLPSSSAMELATGASVGGAFRVLGLPVVGFFARTFRNGTLECGAGACQGNYGSAYPHHPIRTIVPGP